MKIDWKWSFPVLGFIAILEVGSFGFLFMSVAQRQQSNVAALVQNEKRIDNTYSLLSNEKKIDESADTLASNAKKIEQDGQLIRDNKKLLEEISKELHELLVKKCH